MMPAAAVTASNAAGDFSQLHSGAAAAAPAAAAPSPDSVERVKLSREQSNRSTVVTAVQSSSCAPATAPIPAAAAAGLGPMTVPLQSLMLSSQEPLRTASRQKCPGCGKPRAFFCYDCLIPLMRGMPQLPALPVRVHIVMHGETNAQATGTHAAVLAPQSVTLWRHNDGTSHHRRQPASRLQLPDWDPRTTAILFPASPHTAIVGLWGCLKQEQDHTLSSAFAVRSDCPVQQAQKTLAQLSCSSSGGSVQSSSGAGRILFPYEAVVILEGNWAKARTLLKHPKLAPLPCIQLPPHVRSLFWRRGTGSFRAAVDCGVCTIEALYLLCKQLQPEPAGQWDDLLWFWLYQRELVQKMGSHQTRQEMQQNYETACWGEQGC